MAWNKIWSYLAFGFMMLSLGIIIGAKYLAGVEYKVEVQKIKNKRTSGPNSVTIPIQIETPEKPPKRSLAERIKARRDAGAARRKHRRQN